MALNSIVAPSCFLEYGTHFSSETLSTTKTSGTQENKKLEPVSSTSSRGARAAYHDQYPRDFGPRIAHTMSWSSDTSRRPIWQGGREMSSPRPYETYPFHPPALFTSYTINQFQYIYKNVVDISPMWCLHYVLKHWTFVISACALPERLFSRFRAILKWFCPLCGMY